MARRLNSRFLIFLVTLTGAVLLVAGAGLYLHRTSGNFDYKQLEAQADVAVSQKDFEKAALLLKSARDEAPDNTEILVKLGDALNRLTGKDPIHLGEARIQWNKAVSVDPHCLPALRALLKSYADELEINARPEVFVELKGVCGRLLNVVPEDLAALEQKQVAIVHEWLANQTGSNDEVRASIDTELPNLMLKDPQNPELPRTLALALIQQARQALEIGDFDTTRKLLKNTSQMLEDARKGREDNAGFQYRAFQAYLMMKRIDPDVKTDKALEQAYDERISKSLDAALALSSKLDPDKDPLCDDIHQAASEWKSQQNQGDEAEKIMRAYYGAHKNDQRARLIMARVLEIKADPASRDEAVAILKQDVAEAPDRGGFGALVRKDLAAQTVAELIRIYLGDFESTPEKEKDKRKALSGLIDDNIGKLRHIYPPQSVPVLNLEGRFQLLKGENVEAVKTFERAAVQMPANNADPDLLYQLAIAYRRSGQPGRARQRLDQVVLKLDTAVPPRILLMRVLLQAGDIPAARTQLKRLRELAPDSPDVKQLAVALALLDNRDNPAAADLVYSQEPEKTREEQLSKSQQALEIGRADEAARLLETFLKEAPEDARQLAQLPADASDDQKKQAAQKVAQDAQASLGLAQVYALKLDQKETAKRVLQDALKLHPDDPSLVDADARLRELLPDDIYTVVSKAVRKTADPFLRERWMYQLEMGPGGHPEQAFGHLLAAHQLKPDDVQVLDLMFGTYLNTGKFEPAKALLEKLSAQNADQCGGLMYKYRLAFTMGDFAQAEDVGRQTTRDYSEFAAGWLVLAQVLQRRGKFDEAAHDFLEVLNRQPRQYDSYRGLIECYFQLNQLENAEIRLREARKLFPRDPVLRDLLLVYLVNYGKAIEAVPEREKILADGKKQQKDAADDYLQLAKAYFHAAEDESAAKPVESADYLNEAFATLTQGQEKFPDVWQFFSQQAEMQQYNGHPEVGEKILMELYGRPDMRDDPQPALLLSEFFARGGNLEKSELYLNEAMVKAEKKQGAPNIPLRLRLATLQTQRGEFQAAYGTLDGAGDTTKNDPAIVIQRLEILIAEGRRDDARKGLEEELKKHDAINLHILLIGLLIDSREIDAAMRHIDHVLALDPRNDAALYMQCLAFADRNELDRAEEQLRGLRDRDPRNAQYRLLLAELYNKSGKLGYAERELEEALPKMRTNRSVRLALIQLYRAEAPLTNPSLEKVIALCKAAEADPVLMSDPTWAREEALAYASKYPPDVPNTLFHWQQVISLAPNNAGFRREFIDLLIQFHQWDSVKNETDKLVKGGINEWWLHYQRGMALAYLGERDNAIAEFDGALNLTNMKAAQPQGEFILRGLGANLGHDLVLTRLTPLLGNDPDDAWHLLEASELRALGKLKEGEDVVEARLADPANKAPARRLPLLRAKADNCQAYADSVAKDPVRALPASRRARDAYVELVALAPDDVISLNNLANLLADHIPPPEGGPQNAKVYSSKAYDLVRFSRTPNVLVMDTQGWILTLCGGQDAVEGLAILHKMIAERTDTRTFIDGRYHLGEAYLRAAKPDPAMAQKWLKEAMDLIAASEKAGRPVDPVLKDNVQTSLARATEALTSR